MKIHNVPIVGNGIPIMSFKSVTIENTIFMAVISENDEKILDRKAPCVVDINGMACVVQPNNVYAYGAIDFTNKEDLYLLNDCNIPYASALRPVFVYNNYDYKTNTIKTDSKGIKYLESTDNIEIFKQCHGKLNKPERVVIFKASKNDIRRNI